MKKIYINKSRIAGRGAFAGEDIQKGEFVAFYKGRLIHKVYSIASDLQIGKTWTCIRKHWWIAPASPIKFLNHSCSANLGFKTARRMYALRNIAKDEELTIDYSTVEYVDFWSLPCSCGSPRCRKVMRSVQFLPVRTYKAYLPYIPKFFQAIYRQHHKNVRI